MLARWRFLRLACLAKTDQECRQYQRSILPAF